MGRKKKIETFDLISENNEPISKDVQKNEKETLPQKFVKIPIKKEKEKLGINNGRIYKVIDNGYGIYKDSGEIFKI